MGDMKPGKAVEIGSDGNVYFSTTNRATSHVVNLLYVNMKIRFWSGIISEVSDKWIKVRTAMSPAVRPAIVMQYDISKVVIVTEAPEDHQ